ncbi:dihydropteroate synthase [Chloroflexota bacterium]
MVQSHLNGFGWRSKTLAGELGLTRFGSTEFKWGMKTYVMGIINVTPDSFSGDGLDGSVVASLDQARQFVTDGADIIDVGGESTRPGSAPIDVDEELRRVIPVIETLSKEIGVPISIDTYRAEVAKKAVDVGAHMINDVWGLKKDADMANVVATIDVPIVITQNQRGSLYEDFIPDLIADLQKSIDLALSAGIKWENIILDPGVGFGKTIGQNLEIVRRLTEIKALKRPILLGTSRKSFIGYTLALPVEQRLEGTAATVAIGIVNGADIVRVHDVKEMVRVVKMSDAVVRPGYYEAEG